MTHVGANRLEDDLSLQREFFRDRLPVYECLLAEIERALGGRLREALGEAWRGRVFSAWYERPLLLLATLRNDALSEGASHPLWKAVVGRHPDARAVGPEAVARATAPGRAGFWNVLRTRSVQTNETSRAFAWLWPAALYAEKAPDTAVALFDIGASAGLNLVADHLSPIWEREGGEPLRVEPLPRIVGRTGFDRRPVDVRDEGHARWLRACVWPGDGPRIERLDQAIRAFGTLSPSADGPRLVECRLRDVPERLPRPDRAGPRVIAYQTIVRDYVGEPELSQYEHGMSDWLRGTAPGTAVWMEFEISRNPADDAADAHPMSLTAHVRSTDGEVHSLLLATAEPHPRVLRMREGAVDRLRRCLA